MLKIEDFGTYYNTTQECGTTLQEYMSQAKGQDLEVLKLFFGHPDELYTPFEAKAGLHDYVTPVTSIRRAITNLTKLGYLVKTDVMRNGNFGHPNYCWQLNPKWRGA